MFVKMKTLIIFFTLNFFIIKKKPDPLSLTWCMASTSVLLTMISYCFTNKWISMAVMIFFLGGMMIIFIYMVAISNQMTFISPNYSMIILMSIIFTEMNHWDPITQKNFQVEVMYNSLSNTLFILLVAILLMTLILISFITKNWTGPMKSKSYD